MKILNKLTIKHLLMNKKRTLVTIIGITLSTALMVGIGLLTSTYLESMRIDAKNNYGAYHFMIEGIQYQELEKIEANIEVEDSYYYVPLGMHISIVRIFINHIYMLVKQVRIF